MALPQLWKGEGKEPIGVLRVKGRRTLLDLALLCLIYNELLKLVLVSLAQPADVDFRALIHYAFLCVFQLSLRCSWVRIEWDCGCLGLDNGVWPQT